MFSFFVFLNRIFPVVCGGCSTKSLEGCMWNCSSSVLCLILVRYLSMLVLKMTWLVGIAAGAAYKHSKLKSSSNTEVTSSLCCSAFVSSSFFFCFDSPLIMMHVIYVHEHFQRYKWQLNGKCTWKLSRILVTFVPESFTGVASMELHQYN